ncbi:MAG: tetratricopeptide repeat protein [Nitrospirae bacterium]|nr:tetratricopeptide repeat protein [Nitrospirota bacterium]
MHDRHPERLIILLLIVLTLAAYRPALHYEFINYDDYTYVSKNPHLKDGLTWNAVQWAVSTGLVTNYHEELWIPVTYLSHLATIELFGFDPAWHHGVNVGLHVVNTVLLFLLLRRMTGALWPGACVAALFAVHPLHVESVAWVVERKDVLSALFLILTLLAYVRYAEQPTRPRYLAVAAALALGLMSKPMLVTAPFILLLLDYWPLDRFGSGGSNRHDGIMTAWKLVWEKLPLFGLVAVFSALTYFLKGGGMATRSMEWFPLWVRAGNALVSYVGYIEKMLWPLGLAVFYPHPGQTLPPWRVVGAVVVLSLVSIVVVRMRRRRPYLVTGWLWYLVTLLPVIGFIQIGGQAMADRFTYVPLIGLFIMMSWGIDDLTAAWPARRVVLAASAGALLLILLILTRAQLTHWRNSLTLFEHALGVTANNYVAHNNLGMALYDQGRVEESIAHYAEALRIQPNFSPAHCNRADALAKLGRFDEAKDEYARTLAINPADVRAHVNLGVVFAGQGRYGEAVPHYRRALALEPDNPDAHNNLGVALVELGSYQEAVMHYREALDAGAAGGRVHSNLGVALARQGRFDEAMEQFQQALAVEPDSEQAHNNLGYALLQRGRIDDAIGQFTRTLQINPANAAARRNLNDALARRNR